MTETTDTTVSPAEIAAVPLFEGVGEESMAMIAAAARRVSVADGGDLFVAGERANDVFAIERGHVALRASNGRRTTIVMSAGPGELLGWSALRPDAHWMTTGRAAGDVRVIAIPIEAILDLVSGGGEASRELVRRLLGVAAAHLDATQNQLLSSGGEGVITGG